MFSFVRRVAKFCCCKNEMINRLSPRQFFVTLFAVILFSIFARRFSKIELRKDTVTEVHRQTTLPSNAPTGERIDAVF